MSPLSMHIKIITHLQGMRSQFINMVKLQEKKAIFSVKQVRGCFFPFKMTVKDARLVTWMGKVMVWGNRKKLLRKR